LDYPSSSVRYLSGGVITIVVFLELGLVALWIACGAGRQKRSHFWVRVVLASPALPALMVVLVGVARLLVLSLSDDAAKAILSFLFLVGVMALMLVPGLLYRGSGGSPGSSDSDGGGGPGPAQPRSSPDVPRGGVPLPDADPASARARDHNTPKFDDLKWRRPAHEPRRAPAQRTGSTRLRQSGEHRGRKTDGA
jgi:hypothetical protein